MSVRNGYLETCGYVHGFFPRSLSESRCSSIWVTRRTSSIVVMPLRTLFQPSSRNVRMPPSMARAAMVEDAARPIILHSAAGNCWQPHVKNFKPHDNSQYNFSRFEDVWLDK